ncbi:MAG: hypothetical protein HYX52_00130 [Chloroflexi bacterium]|nr:hypothetical protein [Chloroflexota bacterium]
MQPRFADSRTRPEHTSSSELGQPISAAALASRAALALADSAGLDERALARRLFGGDPPPGLLERLLEPLRCNPRFHVDTNRRWHLATVPGARASEGVVGGVAAATIRVGERTHLLGVAVAQAAAGEVETTWHSLFRPRQRLRIAAAIREMLDGDAGALDGAPGLESRWRELQAALGAAPLFCVEPEALQAAIASEAAQTGHGADVMLVGVERAAVRLGVVPGKPSFTAIAAAVGVPLPHAAGRGLDTRACLVARVGRALAERALAAGLSLEDLAQEARARAAPRPLAMGHRVAEAPDAPGVYVFRGDQDAPLYVGKARSLADRLTAYTGRPLAASRRMDGLGEAVRSIDLQPCETELEASIREAYEIERQSPRYNTQRTGSTPRLWITLPPQRVSRARRPRPLSLPRLAVVPEPSPDDAWAVGPFRSSDLAWKLRAVALCAFELDSPRAAGDVEAYRAATVRAYRFLEGSTPDAVQALSEKLDVAIQNRSARLAARLRSSIRIARSYDVTTARFPVDPRSSSLLVVVRIPNGRDLYWLDRLCVRAFTRASAGDDPIVLLSDLLQRQRPPGPVEDASATWALRWLSSAAHRISVAALDPDHPSAALDLLAVSMQALPAHW